MPFTTKGRKGLTAAPAMRIALLGRALCLTLALGAGFTPTGALAQAGTPNCKRDMLVLDSTLRNAMHALEAVGPASEAAKCTAYRKHVDTLHQASKTFARCTTGRERQDNITRMDQSAAEFESLIRARCSKP